MQQMQSRVPPRLLSDAEADAVRSHLKRLAAKAAERYRRCTQCSYRRSARYAEGCYVGMLASYQRQHNVLLPRQYQIHD